MRWNDSISFFGVRAYPLVEHAAVNRGVIGSSPTRGGSNVYRILCIKDREVIEMKISLIETQRLILRGFTKDDALWAYRIWNDPEMGQYLPDEAKEEIDVEYLKMLEGLGDDDKCCYLIPVLKDSMQPVGTCSFMISTDKKIYDIAYCVHKNYWCQGYATEMAQGMIDYARTQGAEKVTVFAGQENLASNRVAVKCGGKVVSESTYRKRGTDVIMKDYKYEILL